MRARSRGVLLAAMLALAGALAVGWYWRTNPPEIAASIPGMVRATEIRIAPEVSGRLARYLVEPGQAVNQGQPVAVLSNPELWAAVGAARAQVDKARSDRDRVYAGIREEQVEMLQREIEKSQAVHAQAMQDLARKVVLAARSDAAVQAVDEAKATVGRDQAAIAIAEARYAEAQRGPTDEERALADATVAASEAARDVIEARAAKMLLRTPAKGVVGILASEIGEAVVPGAPVMTILPENGAWFGVNVREDHISPLSIGAVTSMRVANRNEKVAVKVSELRNWGEFATWRAARASGDHDLNTFFIRLDPVSPTPDLVAGQTAWLSPAEPH